METSTIIIKNNDLLDCQYQFYLFKDFDGNTSCFQIVDDERSFILEHQAMRYKNLRISYNYRSAKCLPFFDLIIGNNSIRLGVEGYCYYPAGGDEKLLLPIERENSEQEQILGNTVNNAYDARQEREKQREIYEQVVVDELSKRYSPLFGEIQDISLFKYALPCLDYSFINSDETIDEEFIYQKFISDFNDFNELFCIADNVNNIIENFIEKYLNREQCYEYICNNIDYSKVIYYFPEVKSFLISIADIENCINEEREHITGFLGFDLLFDENYEWLNYSIIDKEDVLKKVLTIIYDELCEKNNKLKNERLKEKYTFDFVVSLYSAEIMMIKNAKDMEKFLKNLLDKHDCIEECEIDEKIRDFFIRYKKHEEEYSAFIAKHSEGYCLIRYSEEKEAKYHAGNYLLDGKEEAILFNEAKSYFKSFYCTEQSTELKIGKRKNFFGFEYLKSLIDELLKEEVLIEKEERFEFYKVENLKNVKKEMLEYLTWLNSEQGQLVRGKIEELKEKKRKGLKERILLNREFYKYTTKQARLCFLRQFIVDEYEQGRDNYFYCLDAYMQKNLGVCFRGSTAKLFLDEVWSEAKIKEKSILYEWQT